MRAIRSASDVTTGLGLQAEELEERAPGTSVPQVFVSFSHIGGAAEIEQLTDTGQIRQLCDGYEVSLGFAMRTGDVVAVLVVVLGVFFSDV